MLRSNPLARLIVVLCVLACGSCTRSAPPWKGASAAALAVGGSFVCILNPSSEIECWATSHDARAAALPPPGRFIAIAAGHSNACAIAADRTIRCWGKFAFLNRGVPSGQFSSVSVTSLRACAVALDGRLTCWTYSSSGRERYVVDEDPIAYSSIAGEECGLRANGTIYCWNTQFAAAPSGRFLSVSSGPTHSCALRVDGAVVCWGSADRDLIGTHRGPFTSVASGQHLACAIARSGSMECWGGAKRVISLPWGARFRSVSAYGYHVCAIKANGHVWCSSDDD